MNPNIHVFTNDKNGKEVNGVDIDFFVNGALFGSAKSAKGRASIQIDDSSAQIEVRIKHMGLTDSVKLSQGQNSYTFTLPVVVSDSWYKENAPVLVGLGLLLLGISLAFTFEHITNFQKQLIMILVSLGAGGVASIIPGFLKVNMDLGQKLVVSAAGALAVFVLIYFNQPAIFEEPADIPSQTIDNGSG